MHIGAIDVGSNAMRFLVSSFMPTGKDYSYQRIEYLRYPIRLGEDVFKQKEIGKAKEDKFIKMLGAFKTMFEVFEVLSFRACATSAMREAKNGKQIIERVKSELGFELEIIDGETEAELITLAISRMLDSSNYIHIDVGGGSTELNLISNYKKVASKSFNIGTVRALNKGLKEKEWEAVKTFLDEHKLPKMTGVGTGGNIKKLHELAEGRPENAMQLVTLNSIYEVLKNMTLEDRQQKLKLNQDRADVIVPAAEIFSKILSWANVERIYAPNIGLVDGIVTDQWVRGLKNSQSPN
jgi:exopolyphosphatase/guanosine-5'-triphosphate,3'-diphosphate pyrophosphatase